MTSFHNLNHKYLDSSIHNLCLSFLRTQDIKKRSDLCQQTRKHSENGDGWSQRWNQLFHWKRERKRSISLVLEPGRSWKPDQGASGHNYLIALALWRIDKTFKQSLKSKTTATNSATSKSQQFPSVPLISVPRFVLSVRTSE